MKKFIAILMAASILFAHGCASKTETKKEEPVSTTVAVQQTETTQPEVTDIAETTEISTTFKNEGSEQFKKEYFRLLSDHYSEHEITDTENHYYMGTLFADLFDWNLDGVPELMVGHATEDEISYQVHYLDVYTIENGEAKQILTTEVYASYGALDGSQSVIFAYGNDGTLHLGVANDETDEMEALGETYYTFKDGKVEYTRFYADMDVDWENGASTEIIEAKIDGKVVTEKQFNDKRNEIGAEDAFYACIGYCEYDMLLDYLSGATKSYTNQFFSLYDDPEYNPSWVNSVDFGYKTTFTK